MTTTLQQELERIYADGVHIPTESELRALRDGNEAIRSVSPRRIGATLALVDGTISMEDGLAMFPPSSGDIAIKSDL